MWVCWQIVQDAEVVEGRNGKSGNAVVAALATALQSLNMAGAMKALAKELWTGDERSKQQQ